MPEPDTSETYTHGHHDTVHRSHAGRTARNSASYLLPYLTPGIRLLDVGCGIGTITADLAELNHGGQVTGLDPAEEPLTKARAVAEERKLSNLDFEVGSAYQLRYEDATLDVVHAHQVLQHLTDPVAALREMARVTKPGGLVAVADADYAAMTWYPPVPELDDWQDLYQKLARANRAEPNAARHLLAWAHAAGLREVTATAGTWCHADETSRQWWGGMWADRIRQSAIATQAIDAGLADEAELERISAGWRRWAAEPDGWFVILNGQLLIRIGA